MVTVEAFETWKEKMRSIYKTSFSDKRELVQKEGLKPDPAVVNEDGGFLIALRYPPEFSFEIDEFAQKIADRLPAILYRASDIHTTLATYKIAPGFKQFQFNDQEKLQEYVDIEHALFQSVREAIEKIKTSDKSENYYFGNYIYNQSTVIAPGFPKQSFLGIAKSIQSQAKEKNVELKLPWGAHVTVARFVDNITSEEASRALRDIFYWETIDIEYGQIHNSFVKPIAVDVGYFFINRQRGFRFVVRERFPLS